MRRYAYGPAHRTETRRRQLEITHPRIEAKVYPAEECRDSMLLLRVRNARVSRTTLSTAGDSWKL